MATTKKTATPQEVWAGIKELTDAVTASKKESDRRFRKLEELFTGQWGKLMESLVEGDLVSLLKERKIDVVATMTRIKTDREDVPNYEYDILAMNGREAVVVEVKTTLGKRDVDYFIKKLNVFKEIFKEYSNKEIYGAVAYLRENSGAVKYSEKKGLLVIRASGSSASIINKKSFKPKPFGRR